MIEKINKERSELNFKAVSSVILSGVSGTDGSIITRSTDGAT